MNMIECIDGVYYLRGKSFCYCLTADGYGNLVHVYYGRNIARFSGRNLEKISAKPYRAFCAEGNDGKYMESTLQEYPAAGRLDTGMPAYRVETANKCRISCLKCDRFEIMEGKPALAGLPSFRNEAGAQTLCVSLLDRECGLETTLYYTVYPAYDVLCRHAELKNVSAGNMRLIQASSAQYALPQGDYETVRLAGTWANERQPVKERLLPGRYCFGSEKGTSSHQFNPFVAICERGANETYGNVYAFSLVYSGSFSAAAEKGVYGDIRVGLGVNFEAGAYDLACGESFVTPECVSVCSCGGFEQMSHAMHSAVNELLISPRWRYRERPILINNWEATYFDFNRDKLLAIADTAAGLGVELFVLDDGWFGKRDLDNSSLGDWVEYPSKLPGGLSELSGLIKARGMQFGLWFEPEMISENSDLYRKHPDWAIRAGERAPMRMRNQLVLDFTRGEVTDYLYTALSEIINRAQLNYIKWDMNRYLLDMPTADFAHRYVLGLYRLLQKLTETFPDVLFEGCAGGGGRFDMGMLYYFPQIWTSDNTDAVARLSIQEGTSLPYPLSTIGAHVTAVPNHQLGRVTPLCTRGAVSFFGNLGYELDLGKLREEERAEIKKQISRYKAHRKEIVRGAFYRLKAADSQFCAWQIVGEKHVFVSAIQRLARAETYCGALALRGLEQNAAYRDTENGTCYGGDELMRYGVPLSPEQKDFSSCFMILERV